MNTNGELFLYNIPGYIIFAHCNNAGGVVYFIDNR